MSSVTRDVWLWLYGIERHSVNDLVRLLLGKLFRARALERRRETHTVCARHPHRAKRVVELTAPCAPRKRNGGTRWRSGKVTDSKSIKVKPAPRTALELTAELDTQRKDSSLHLRA